ncbi:MAG: hypothetical protein HKN23_07520 [Verrucomicrobiales bacterium]|nr:hypothetical protein [Verrucomicrobiales bacterium]
MSTSLTIKDSTVKATTPEGQTASMSVADLVEKVSGRRPEFRGAILPDGIKAVLHRGPIEIWIHQTPPQKFLFRWISAQSEVKYGKGAEYRDVSLALPYLITFAVFVPGMNGTLTLSQNNECFFSNQPLNWEDELCYPALLNCSKFRNPDGSPLSWICSQYLPRKFEAEPDTGKKMRMAFAELLHCLLDTGFNYSSEHHEGSSWFSESTNIDPRIATVEAWEKASDTDPEFYREIPWLSTGLNAGQIADRIFDLHHARAPRFDSARALARLVFNHAIRTSKQTASSPVQPELPGPFNPFTDSSL